MVTGDVIHSFSGSTYSDTIRLESGGHAEIGGDIRATNASAVRALGGIAYVGGDIRVDATGDATPGSHLDQTGVTASNGSQVMVEGSIHVTSNKGFVTGVVAEIYSTVEVGGDVTVEVISRSDGGSFAGGPVVHGAVASRNSTITIDGAINGVDESLPQAGYVAFEVGTTNPGTSPYGIGIDYINRKVADCETGTTLGGYRTYAYSYLYTYRGPGIPNPIYHGQPFADSIWVKELSENPASTLRLDQMPDVELKEGEAWVMRIPVTTTGNQSVVLGYSVSGLPGGLSYAQNGVISGTADGGSAGEYNVDVKVTWGALTEQGGFKLTVTSTGSAAAELVLYPISDVTIKVNTPLTLTLGYSYSGNDPLGWTADHLPAGLGIAQSTGVISGAPTQTGTFDVDVTVTDGVLADSGGFRLTVEDSDPAPGPGTDTYILTIRAGTGGRVSTGGGRYREGERVSITAMPDSGYSFSGWSATSGDLDDRSGAGTTFTMPAGDATVTATFTHAPSGSFGSSSRGSGGSSTPDAVAIKTQLPASAFSWDGRTLTIDYERITHLGLLSVRWDDVTLARGTEYSVYEGSVIVRFGEDFMAAQAPGDHTIRVEFMNHIGETTVTVGGTGAAHEDDNETYNPSTGGYPDSGMGATDNPNTGDGRGIWPALLLGSLGGIVLVIRRLKPVA